MKISGLNRGIRTLTSAMPLQCKMTLLTPNQFDRLMISMPTDVFPVRGYWSDFLAHQNVRALKIICCEAGFDIVQLEFPLLGRLLKLRRKLRLHFAWLPEHNSENFQTRKKKIYMYLYIDVYIYIYTPVFKNVAISSYIWYIYAFCFLIKKVLT